MEIRGTSSQSKSFSLNLGSELGHALFRFSSTLAFALYLLLAAYAGHITDFRNAKVGILAYLSFGVIWIGVVGFSILTFKVRRLLSIVLDQAVFAFALYHAGEVLAPVLWAPVLMAIGNGLRNGPGYAKLSAFLGGACIAVALSLSPYWHTDRLVTEGIVLAIIVLPLYTLVLSEQIASAKREMQLRAARFESASRTDSLTGILNRSGFFQVLGKMIEQVNASGTRSAVMLLDLDGFKAVNDACGHAAGDEVLREVAARLRDCLNISDRIARIGGDEFGIVVPGVSSTNDVERVAQALIDSVAQIRIAGHPELTLGASIGICLLPDDDCRDEISIMKTADRLMYTAKKAGKNCFRTDA